MIGVDFLGSKQDTQRSKFNETPPPPYADRPTVSPPLISSTLSLWASVDVLRDVHSLKFSFSFLRLTVDLLAGRDLAFHFNPRFKDEADGKVTVMNSCLDEKWGHEERDRQHFPFVPGQSFQVRATPLCH